MIYKKLITIIYIFTLITTLMINNNTKAQTVAQTMESEGKRYKIYLTFDDGPSRNTEKVLNVLDSYDIKATFFVIGCTGEYEISIYNRIIEDGHALGLHSYTHNIKKIYKSSDSYIKDFERLQEWLFEKTGESPKICRMVGGSNSKLCSKGTRTQIINYFNENGYICYDWDIDPRDSRSYALDAGSIANNIMRSAHKKPEQDLVILLHDDAIRKTLPAALEIVIPQFIEKGYTFDTLDADTVLNNSRAMVI